MCESLLLLCGAPYLLFGLPVFQVQGIGPAGYGSTATAINGEGAIVGNYLAPDGTSRAFLWRGGQVTTLALPAGALQTWASAIGGTGQAGGYMDGLQATQGVVWDDSGNPAGTTGSYILGLNSSGDAAGMGIAADGTGYAFVTRSGLMTSLGQPGGGSWSSANAISNSGAAAGTAMTAAGAFRAFLAGTDGTAALLAGLGGSNAYGMAINDSGAVAGHSQRASGALEATIWDGATATGLGTLGGANSYAYAINAAGQVAGYSDTNDAAGSAAFLYDGGILHDLNSLLEPNSEWQLLAAYGMNNSGQIVGRGRLNGLEQGFLLTPVAPVLNADHSIVVPVNETGIPEPSSIWLVGPPILAYFALRGRHR